MSTKIYNGFRLTREDISLSEFHSMCNRLQKRMLKIAKLNYNRSILEEAIHEFDNNYTNDPENAPSILDCIKVSSNHIREDLKGPYASVYDYGCSVTIFPAKVHNQQYTVGILHTQVEEFRKMWFEQNTIAEFGYWNSADRPDEISATEWAHRESVWKKALPGVGIPASSGYNRVLVDRQDFMFDI